MKRIAIFGGSFDPPHLGHIDAAEAAFEQLQPDELLFVPSFISPHKTADEFSANAEDRLNMTRLAVESLPYAKVSDLEAARGGVSYTADTLELLRELYPDARLYLLMGADMFLSFENWYRFTRILELCTLTPFVREPGQEEEILTHARHLKESYHAYVELIKKAPLRLSSTEVRAAFRRGEGRFSVPSEVYDYIVRKRLYGVAPDLDWLREKVYKAMDEARIEHTRGTEAEAVRLARRWGADIQAAAEAAILHDVTKKLKKEEQLILCEEYGIINDSSELAYTKLLHAKTGAALARSVFGVSDDVYNAIRFHTTGRADMTVLEKIIYLADYIEPGRDLDGLAELRRLAYEDIDEAMILALTMSLLEVEAGGRVPHENTKAAIEFLLHLRKDESYE